MAERWWLCFDIEGYNMVEKHRQSQSGGGFAIHIKDSMEYDVRNDLVTFNKHIESILLKYIKNIWQPRKI